MFVTVLAIPLFSCMDVEKYPLLKEKMADLTDNQRDELLTRLNAESRTICSQFAVVVTQAQQKLWQSVIAEDFITLFTTYKLEELAEQIDHSDRVFEIFEKIRKGNYWSFFNYELLEIIINAFLRDTSLVKEMANYLVKFKEYCQHRVSEVPRGIVNGENVDPNYSSGMFKVKMDDEFCVQASDIKDVQHKLQIILNEKPILLADVDHGCIELIFRHFNKAGIFPIEETKKVALAEIGVVVIFDKDEVLFTPTITESAPASKPSTTSKPSLAG